MAQKSTLQNKMRIYHRYLGFFLAGIMAVYAISGVVLIFRTTDFLKEKKTVVKTVDPNLNPEELGKALKIRELKITSETNEQMNFREGTYNRTTGSAIYTTKTLPPAIEKLTQLHKANTNQPLFYLNVFFGGALLFFVVSSFYMFMPGTTIFKKGMYFTFGGILLTVLLLFVG